MLVLHILFSANVKPLFESSVSCWFLCRSNVLFGQMIFKDECWTQLRFIVCCCFFTSGDFVLLVFLVVSRFLFVFVGFFFFLNIAFCPVADLKKKKKSYYLYIFIHI